jgi:hypothetical protein
MTANSIAFAYPRHMTIRLTQANRELEAFDRFLRLRLLSIDPGSLEKRHEPEPDILCRLRGEGLVAFELAELCAEDVAKLVANPETKFTWSADPAPRIVRKKLKKKYLTPYPIELLLYAEGRLVSTDDMIIHAIRPIFEGRGGGPFRRVWLHGEHGGYEVWRAVPDIGGPCPT